MSGVKFLSISLALIFALSALTLAGSVRASDRLVDQTAEVELMATDMAPAGAEGEAELKLRIDEMGMLELFRIKADAEGLLAGVTYSLFVGKHLIATGIADANGDISFDAKVEGVKAHKDTLLGLKVKIIEGTTIDGKVVLVGKVTEIEEEEVED